MDASVIAVCDRLSVLTVATMNRHDFANVRLCHVPASAIVP
jgi:hypothetical protein